MTMNEAHAALVVPAHTVNVNTVQDGQARLREALRPYRDLDGEAEAPRYVQDMVRGLASWVAHASR